MLFERDFGLFIVVSCPIVVGRCTFDLVESVEGGEQLTDNAKPIKRLSLDSDSHSM